MNDGRINPDVQDPAVACFGFGRRICPGRFWAYDAMWIAIATTLATVTISPPKDADGKPIVPKGDYKDGFLWWVFCGNLFLAPTHVDRILASYPAPFDCEIKARSAEYLALLEAEDHEVLV